MGPCSGIHHMVTSIEGCPNSFVSLDKPFQLNVQVLILATQYVAMGIQSINLSLRVLVSIQYILIAEPYVVLFFS